MKLRSLCVYCGSSRGAKPEYMETARAFGQQLAERGITLVYGGGNVGLMGAVADGALDAGGRVIGVIPHALIEMEVAHSALTELYAVDDMHARKAKMAELSDAFVALPGGIGTLEEIFEVLTWNQLHLHTKACALLNIAGYYDSMCAFLRNMVTERFLRQENLDTLLVETDPIALLERLAQYEPVKVDKWIDR